MLQFKAFSNGYSLDNYYEKCGALPDTIIIVKTISGKIIGGYTPLSFYPAGGKWTC